MLGWETLGGTVPPGQETSSGYLAGISILYQMARQTQKWHFKLKDQTTANRSGIYRQTSKKNRQGKRKWGVREDGIQLEGNYCDGTWQKTAERFRWWLVLAASRRTNISNIKTSTVPKVNASNSTCQKGWDIYLTRKLVIAVKRNVYKVLADSEREHSDTCLLWL